MKPYLSLLALCLLTACKRTAIPPQSFVATKSGEMADKRLEMPRSPHGMQEQIIEHTGYVTSYNATRRQPNWVAYELTPNEARGKLNREGEFQADPLARGRSANNADYSRSGYGRGHMAPAGDMKWDARAMRESFYLSNVCPQRHSLNAGLWNDLEMGIRQMARKGQVVHIACGPVFPKNKEARTIGYGKVAVPDSFFKVLLTQHNGRYAAIGYIFPNTDCKGAVNDYACSVDEVERQTGIDFFPALPDNIENAVESTADTSRWKWRTSSSDNHFRQRGSRQRSRENAFKRQ